MTDFEKIILKGEGKTLEFKAQLPTGNSIAKSSISFSNMAGGKIIIGVEDKTCKIRKDKGTINMMCRLRRYERLL